MTAVRTANSYAGVASTVGSGNGSGATFDVVVAADGTATVTNGTPATGGGGTLYTVGDTISIADAVLGTGGAPAITFAVATVGNISIADFIAQATTGTYDVESGNALAVTFDDSTIAAEDLIAANNLTTGLITVDNGGSAGTLTGNTTDLVSVYTAAELETPTITGTADYALTVSNAYTTDADGVSTNDGILSAADLVSLNASTTGLITIDPFVTDGTTDNSQQTITTLSGSFDDVHAVLTADKLVADSSTDTTGSEAADIGISGLFIAAGGGANSDGTTIAVTLTDSSVSVANVNDIVDNYTAIAAAGAIAAQNGIGAVTATITETDMDTLDDLTTTGGNFTITVADASVDTNKLSVLDGDTTGTITVTSTTLTGDLNDDTLAADNVNLTLDSSGISGLGSIGVTSDQTSNTVAEVNTVSAKTTGVVTASITETTLTALADINETGNAYTITVGDSSVDAAALNVLNGKTTGVVTVNATTITGALSDIKTLYDANSDETVAGLGNESITISDTGTVSASTINDLNGLTTGVIRLNTATTVSGSLSELTTLYDANNAGTVTGLGNETLQVTGSVTSSELATLNGFTTGTVSVSTSATTIAASTLNTLDSESTTVVDASTITTLTGNAADINTAYASSGISGLGNEAVTLSYT
jgi:hypothetical protein